MSTGSSGTDLLRLGSSDVTRDFARASRLGFEVSRSNSGWLSRPSFSTAPRATAGLEMIRYWV